VDFNKCLWRPGEERHYAEEDTIDGLRLERVTIGKLRPNPFRRLDEYPILREKVEMLKKSMETTFFWGTIVGRPVDRGCVEIAFGHHRLVGLREACGDKGLVDLIICDLSDAEMLRMMASENMEEWGASAWVELETVRATIEAYRKGLIELPSIAKKTRRSVVRDGGKPGVDEEIWDEYLRDVRERVPVHRRLYTKATVAQFLGWIEADGAPNRACDIAFMALDMMEDGLITEEEIKGLTREGAYETLTGQHKIRDDEEALAESNRSGAELVEQVAARTEDPVHREALQERASVLRRQEQQHKKAAKH
jgi:hypothetical protein